MKLPRIPLPSQFAIAFILTITTEALFIPNHEEVKLPPVDHGKVYTAAVTAMTRKVPDSVATVSFANSSEREGTMIVQLDRDGNVYHFRSVMTVSSSEGERQEIVWTAQVLRDPNTRELRVEDIEEHVKG